MGRFEDMMTAIDPLERSIGGRYALSWDRCGNSLDILTSLSHAEGWLTFLIHKEADDTAGLYFLLAPYNDRYVFMKNRAELITREKMAIFPGENVLRILGTEYTHSSKGYLEDLKDLSQFMSDHADRIIELFSETNVEKTYHDLIAMPGNDDEQIQKIVHAHFAYGFAHTKRRTNSERENRRFKG